MNDNTIIDSLIKNWKLSIKQLLSLIFLINANEQSLQYQWSLKPCITLIKIALHWLSVFLLIMSATSELCPSK